MHHFAKTGSGHTHKEKLQKECRFLAVCGGSGGGRRLDGRWRDGAEQKQLACFVLSLSWRIAAAHNGNLTTES